MEKRYIFLDDEDELSPVIHFTDEDIGRMDEHCDWWEAATESRGKESADVETALLAGGEAIKELRRIIAAWQPLPDPPEAD